ncbi:dehydrogenase/reductase SDR family member 11 isoform X5 [Microtus ochrogaster]|uniref:Dehydrogenase/reductase SDR family member 11 isoform X5 n=1 Tax=Microtus ochrogaster TaxID=79684 RepID=A0ABM1U3H9_MICOH|nr:dehydrogenase/reductase SDR family member 11 isoform X5 [Microtus ochrogaster]
MWPGAEVPRAEPRPEAGPHGGGTRRCSDVCRLPAPAPAVTRERPSSVISVPGSPNGVGGRLGTMARAGMERWRDRLALVTGASGGIGAAVARALVQQGLKVVGCARTVGNIEELAAECKSAGYPGTLIPYRCDLSNEEDILSMFSAVRSQHHGVDICINNAGMARPDTLLSGSTSGWKDMFNVNVLALSICTREAYQSMKERNVDDGHIININRLSRTSLLAQCISPGLVETRFAFKLHDKDPERAAATYEDIKCLKPEDVAEAVIYVLSTPPHVQHLNDDPATQNSQTDFFNQPPQTPAKTSDASQDFKPQTPAISDTRDPSTCTTKIIGYIRDPSTPKSQQEAVMKDRATPLFLTL